LNISTPNAEKADNKRSF